MKYAFGDIVVVEGINIGVIVKCWGISNRGIGPTYEVYVRMYNGIKDYDETDIERYMVRHKYLSDEEVEWQRNGINGI